MCYALTILLTLIPMALIQCVYFIDGKPQIRCNCQIQFKYHTALCPLIRTNFGHPFDHEDHLLDFGYYGLVNLTGLYILPHTTQPFPVSVILTLYFVSTSDMFPFAPTCTLGQSPRPDHPLMLNRRYQSINQSGYAQKRPLIMHTLPARVEAP